MEVVVPRRKDMHFDSTTSTPYVSAPTSPKRFDAAAGPFDYYCHYTSAPTSPARAAAIYADAAAASVVPFDWEEAPGTPKSRSPRPCDRDDDDDDRDDDYVFEFSGQLEKGVVPPELAAADELFEEGRIRPLKPPPRLYNLNVNDHKSNMNMTSSSSSSPSPRSSKGGGLWSSRQKKKHGGSEGIDPFAAAMVEATRERGREKESTVPSPSSSSIPSSRSRKGSRSLSPMRGGGGGEFTQSSVNSPSQASTSSAAASFSSVKSRGGSSSRKWRLRDLLLFRSASEGRATGNASKDPLRKFSFLSIKDSLASITSSPSHVKRGGEDSRNSSFRSTDSGGSSMRRGGGGMSPHEMHYTSNRAATEERRRRTALPFGSQGLFGCLRFNPAVQSVARGFHNSSTFNHRRQL